jgi:hypothetical protein
MKKLVILLLAFLISACTTPPKEPVTFSDSPATDEEQAIASVLEAMILSYNESDIEKHLSYYAPDARIDSKLAGGFVSHDEYRQVLQKRGRLSTIRLKDTKITKVSADKYQVDTTLVGPSGSASLIYDLSPIEGRWLVIEQRYK